MKKLSMLTMIIVIVKPATLHATIGWCRIFEKLVSRFVEVKGATKAVGAD